jgi:hypothetical protein
MQCANGLELNLEAFERERLTAAFIVCDDRHSLKWPSTLPDRRNTTALIAGRCVLRVTSRL